MRHLVIGICVAISLWSSGALAQSCAPGQADAFFEVGDRIRNTGANINTWMKNNLKSQQYDRVEYFHGQIEQIELLLSHLSDLAVIGDMNSNKRVDEYVNLSISFIRVSLESYRRTMNGDLTRINAAYVVAEGRAALSEMEKVSSLLRRCIAPDRSRR